MPEVKYEDLPIIFQSDGAITDEIDEAAWDYIWMVYMIRRNIDYAYRPGDIT